MKTFITKKQWIEIFPEAKEYVQKELDKQMEICEKQSEVMKLQIDFSDNEMFSKELKEFMEDIRRYFIEEDIRQTEKKIRNLYAYIRNENISKGKITDQDIIRAKEFSFENLIEFKKNRTKCPFHNEKTASFYYNKKNNTAHCFGECNRTWDTIAFVMETENLNFIEAVKLLNK